MLTYFVVQAYARTRMGALSPQPPVQAQDEGHAMRMAARLAGSMAGVVAFCRSGDPGTGEYEDAEILAQYGEVPGLEALLSVAC